MRSVGSASQGTARRYSLAGAGTPLCFPSRRVRRRWRVGHDGRSREVGTPLCPPSSRWRRRRWIRRSGLTREGERAGCQPPLPSPLRGGDRAGPRRLLRATSPQEPILRRIGLSTGGLAPGTLAARHGAPTSRAFGRRERPSGSAAPAGGALGRHPRWRSPEPSPRSAGLLWALSQAPKTRRQGRLRRRRSQRAPLGFGGRARGPRERSWTPSGRCRFAALRAAPASSRRTPVSCS